MFRYRPDVLAHLERHGVRPTPQTPPQLVRDYVRDLYKYEIRALRERYVRQVDRLVEACSPTRSVDELDLVGVEADRRGAHVPQLQELGRVRRGLVVVDLVDDDGG